MKRNWSIFGCGPSGLYTAWRLTTSHKIVAGDSLSLYEWGDYRLDGQESGSRSAAGRICTYHYQDDPGNSFIEIGGMRYIYWNGDKDAAGQRLITTVIGKLDLKPTSIPFNTTNDPLFYLRQENFYSTDITPSSPAPYNADHGLAGYPPSAGDNSTYSFVSKQTLGGKDRKGRQEQCSFYAEGVIPENFTSDVYKSGDPLRNIGFWNLSFDILGGEGYRYSAAGGGYQSNVINVNAATEVIMNSEFEPGEQFKTLRGGFSSIYPALFREIQRYCSEHDIEFNYRPRTRLRSIWLDPKNNDAITFTLADAGDPTKTAESGVTDCAFLAMPPGSLDIVADASRYQDGDIIDVLNDEKVALYRDSVIKQPSYKVAMFFDSEWWKEAKYPPRLVGDKSNKDAKTGEDIPNVFGPTITDTPLRQVYYFGDNAPTAKGEAFGILASYDDERFYRFWQELELGPDESREIPLSRNLQPLEGAGKAPDVMVRMLRSQLARVHWGAGADASMVPEPLETMYMDWSLRPFSGGYHGWAPHYDVNDVMQKIRKPTQLIDGIDADLFIVGSAYSNDQAWVEGAFCSAESVLVKFFHLDPLTSQEQYPFICRCKE